MKRQWLVVWGLLLLLACSDSQRVTYSYPRLNFTGIDDVVTTLRVELRVKDNGRYVLFSENVLIQDCPCDGRTVDLVAPNDSSSPLFLLALGTTEEGTVVNWAIEPLPTARKKHSIQLSTVDCQDSAKEAFCLSDAGPFGKCTGDEALSDCSGCDDAPEEGQCVGNVLIVCTDGETTEVDCAVSGKQCAWSGDDEQYQCLTCQAQCAGKVCGDDGCGGSCGECSVGTQCTDGNCVECVSECGGKACGDDGCGGSCGTCPEGQVCTDGACQGCIPECTGKFCGDDGCGGDCGQCLDEQVCMQGVCKVCVPSCAGKECGDNGCGGTCGECNDNNQCTDDTCENAQCVFKPSNCDDESACTVDSCESVVGCINTEDCDDENPCTLDVCDGVACKNTATEGEPCPDDGDSCTGNGVCAADGTCVNESLIGTVCETANGCINVGELNPFNSCQKCTAVSNDQVTFSDLANGEPCCGNGTCEEGECAMPQGVKELCNGKDDDCDGQIDEDFPLLGTACVGGDGVCEEKGVYVCSANGADLVCKTSGQAGKGCDDGDPCTKADKCSGGNQSVCQGTAYTCDDGLACTGNVCLGDGNCSFPAVDGTCLIAGECFEKLAANGKNSCEQCLPGVSLTTWSNAAIGTLCNDGIDCTASDQCDGAGGCTGTLQNCDDGQPCTLDSCDDGACVNTLASDKCLIDGKCEFSGASHPNNECETCNPKNPGKWTVNVGQTCNDGNPCTLDDACTEDASCGGTVLDCSDELSCTADLCEGDQCVNKLIDGFCLIDGQCVEEGALHPSQPCKVCALSQPTAWTVLLGASCSDGNACTVSDLCDASGICKGSAKNCDDGIPCTKNNCDSESGQCLNTIPPGFCVIDGQCKSDQTAHPTNACQLCNSSSNKNGWSVAVGKACDDGQNCTVNDACAENGTCKGEGKLCDDGKSCTENTCDSSSGQCTHPPKSGKCLITGKCYANSDVNPQNSCLSCQPNSNQKTWTNKANGAVCPDDGLSCTNDQCSDGKCVHPLKANACFIDDKCYSNDKVSPDNECLICDASASTSEWSNKTNGLPCNTGNNWICVQGNCIFIQVPGGGIPK